VQTITLDATNWTDPADFHAALGRAMHAPAWYGSNLDALYDALSGGIWTVEPPYTVVILNASPNLRPFLNRADQVFAEARAEFGIDVTLHL
jgi:RNAse (barnase) inhibitor barstar